MVKKKVEPPWDFFQEITKYEILEQGLDRESVSDFECCTPLTYAIIGGKKEIAQYLISLGSKLQKGEDYFREGDGKDDGSPAWTWDAVCAYGTVDSANLLLELDDEPTEEDLLMGYGGCRDEIFHLLREKGITLKGKEYLIMEGATPKHVLDLLDEGVESSEEVLCNAIEWRDYDLVQTLLAKGIDNPHIENDPPIIIAIDNGDLKCLQYLVEAGYDVNGEVVFESLYKDDDEESLEVTGTPLHVAAQLTSKDIVEYLLEHGADKDKKDSDGNRPYDYAADEFADLLE